MVGPGIQPASIARRSAVSAYRPLLPRSRSTVKPWSSSVNALPAPWSARYAVVSVTCIGEERRGVEDPVAERRRAAVQRHGLHQRHRQMVVRFDEAGQDGQVRQVDHFRAGGNRDVRADRGDLAVLDEDDLVRRRRAGVGIDQASGPDRDRRRPAPQEEERAAVERERRNRVSPASMNDDIASSTSPSRFRYRQRSSQNHDSTTPIWSLVCSCFSIAVLEIHPEPELLLPLRELGLRLAERRRLQAALEAREVVGSNRLKLPRIPSPTGGRRT